MRGIDGIHHASADGPEFKRNAGDVTIRTDSCAARTSPALLHEQ